MEIKKGLFALSLIGTLIIGSGAGAYGDYYLSITRPQNVAMAAAQKQHDNLNQMIRHGKVVDVKPNQVTVKITRSGLDGEVGKTKTFSTDQYTNVQNGFQMVNKPGDPTVDLTKYVKVGMEIDLLVKGNKAYAVHWDVPGQAPPAPTVNQ